MSCSQSAFTRGDQIRVPPSTMFLFTTCLKHRSMHNLSIVDIYRKQTSWVALIDCMPRSTSFWKMCLLKVSNEFLPGAGSEYSKILPQVLHSVFLYLFHSLFPFHSLWLSCSCLPSIVIPHLPFFNSPLTSSLFFHSLYLCVSHNSYLLWHHANHQHNFWNLKLRWLALKMPIHTIKSYLI